MPTDIDQTYLSRHWVPTNLPPENRHRSIETIAGRLAGALTAAFILVGRWEPAGRGDFGFLDTRRVDFDEPRFLIAVALVVVVSVLPLARLRRRFRDPRRRLQPEHVVVALWVFLVFSVVWAIDRPVATAKASELVLVGVFAAIFGTLAMGRLGKTVQNAFWVSLLSVSGLLGLFGAVNVVTAGLGATNRYIVAPLGGGPNVFGRNMAVLAVASTALALSDRISRRIGLPIAAFAGLLVVLSGSRGALVALGLGILVAVLHTRPSVKTVVATSVLIVLSLVVLGGSTTIVDQAGTVFSQRLDLGNLQEQYAGARAIPFQEGIACYADHPVSGVGIGGFALLGSENTYPHNIFLELACEGGSFALFLGLWVLGLVAAVFIRARSLLDPAAVAVLAVAFGSAQFSGDLFDSRGIVIFGILALASTRQLPVHHKARSELAPAASTQRDGGPVRL